MFTKLLKKQYDRFLERNWDTLYFIVDVHEVVLMPDYEKQAREFYPLAKETLQMLSNRSEVCLIMWTASIKEHRENYLDFFREHGINFRYINENPEIPAITTWGDYRSKMYANVGLDDKFGFDPETHWQEIWDFYNIEQEHVSGAEFVELAAAVLRRHNSDYYKDHFVEIRRNPNSYELLEITRERMPQISDSFSGYNPVTVQWKDGRIIRHHGEHSFLTKHMKRLAYG